MYDTKKDILKALASTPKALAALLPAVLARQSKRTSPASAVWSAVEIVCHLRDAEERALERTRRMRNESNPFIKGYDQDQLARERNYKADDPEKALSAFTSFRQEHVAELESLPFPDWERTGEHEEMGRITILAHALHIVSHDLNHLAQLSGS